MHVTDSFAQLLRAPRAPGANPYHKDILDLLRAVRTHLGMDVAFVSEFCGNRRVFRYVDSVDGVEIIAVGGSDPLDESYCQRILDGRLPGLIRDATALSAARLIPATLELPIGAHLSVPIKLKDGQVYGTFCCFSFKPDETLTERDLNMMRIFADLTAEKIDYDIELAHAHRGAHERIARIFESDLLSVLYQPIYSLTEHRAIGYEALSRFNCEPAQSPDIWFSEAFKVGLGDELEARALQRALAGLDLLEGAYLSVNASPGFIMAGGLERVLPVSARDRIVVEITEHSSIEDYEGLARRLRPLMDDGLRIAVDDAGAGYASFRHILHLEPHLIKLDASITRNIDSDFSRRALAIAFISFALATGAEIVAEGVETRAQLDVLRELGVDKVQGNLVGEPAVPGATVAAA